MAELIINTSELTVKGKRWVTFGTGFHEADIYDKIAGLLESQTKRRLMDEKTDPEGREWKEWSDEYAKTRKAHHSLLISSGHMHDDVFGEGLPGIGARVGSPREYAAEQNTARPFLGMSRENAREVEIEILDYLREIL